MKKFVFVTLVGHLRELFLHAGMISVGLVNLHGANLEFWNQI